MTTNIKVTVGIVVATVLGLFGALLVSGGGAGSAESGGAPGSASAPELVRADSHRISDAPEGSVTFVEFLDFECEACRAAYPTVEQLRAEFGDRVSFVLRYFPIPSHTNAENAAVAVEAAAQQGQLEVMYSRMYETQGEWGEASESRADVFRGFAEDLGLDMVAFDDAVADPATLERVVSDRNDGVALGVEGTPTFFLEGEQLQPQSPQDLRTAIEDALAGRP